MKKSEFRLMLVIELIKQYGEGNVNEDAVNSALSKSAVWMKNAFGRVDWEEFEMENGIDNAVTFYDEYGVDSGTHNQISYQQRRK